MFSRFRRRYREQIRVTLIGALAIGLSWGLFVIWMNSPGSRGAQPTGICTGNFCVQ